MKTRRGKSAQTPIRVALRSASSLRSDVRDGLEAMKKNDRDCIDIRLRSKFADSLDLDKAMQAGHEEENRWDYLLGHEPNLKVIAVEPHSAKSDQISTVIKKRQAARRQLASHLEPNVRIDRWLWVTSGKNHFADTEKARRRLDQHGITFVGAQVQQKHIE
jgi:hypothetical protein